MKDDALIVGIDEVGRGPLAGPVAVGAVSISKEREVWLRKTFGGITDSKQLTAKKRVRWYEKMCEEQKKGNLQFKVSYTSAKTIDKIGIVPSIKKSLTRALAGVTAGAKKDSCRILLDGGLSAPTSYQNQETIIRGDQSEMLISMASVVAKVLRDRKMTEYAKQGEFHLYRFERHKGYGTKEHIKCIKKYGKSSLHRESFLTRIAK